MNNFETNNTGLSDIMNREKKYVPMDLNEISNIISQKFNCMKSIDETLINELCNGLKLYCQNHNEMINDWFDENYINDLEMLKYNNNKYSELSEKFSLNSFIKIKTLID